MAEEREDFEGEDSTDAPLVTWAGGFWIKVILALPCLQDFDNDVWLTPMTQGIHLPGSIYNYMQENFFTWICSEV